MVSVYLLTSSVVRYVAVRSFPRTHYQRHTYSFIINKGFCHRFTISNVSVVATKYIILLNSFSLFRVLPFTYLCSSINIVLLLLLGVLYQITLILSLSLFLFPVFFDVLMSPLLFCGYFLPTLFSPYDPRRFLVGVSRLRDCCCSK